MFAFIIDVGRLHHCLISSRASLRTTLVIVVTAVELYSLGRVLLILERGHRLFDKAMFICIGRLLREFIYTSTHVIAQMIKSALFMSHLASL